MKEQIKTPEKEQNKTVIAMYIRMLKEIIEYSNNIKEEMKVTLSERNKETSTGNRVKERSQDSNQ